MEPEKIANLAAILMAGMLANPNKDCDVNSPALMQMCVNSARELLIVSEQPAMHREGFPR